MTHRLDCGLLLSILLAINYLAVVEAQYWTPCRTPIGESGSCVLVAECNFIRQVLQKPLLENNDIRYIEASRCGVYQKKALVCCAQPSGNPPTPAPAPAVDPGLVQQQHNENRFQPSGSLATKRSLLPSDPVCGTQLSDRIIGGERTKIDEYPWTARIGRVDVRNNEFAFFCGGSLINERYVLTAAHCVVGIPRAWRIASVRLGEWDAESDPDCIEGECYDPVQDIEVEKPIAHERYVNSRQGVHNDIALLRLARKAKYEDTVVPICLPIDRNFAGQSYEGRKMIVTGWGQTETSKGSRYKLFVSLTGVPRDYCQQQFPTASIDETQICAGGEAGKDSCRGDSGGPLMDVSLDKGRAVLYLAGIVSFGSKNCGSAGVPGVYTKVNMYGDWILNNIEP
ncbi:CLIP domain-containing serine protease B4-like [Uranotaenia lowii]|uniref:CLIP domain-containing serine protease B4-like n=1 Tax=Uranotaenia lowii TaxID=190385 RepID=UPI00247923F7|nr:CLIP domain-containing serine protease B4-like [Uranotaenia lowii]